MATIHIDAANNFFDIASFDGRLRLWKIPSVLYVSMFTSTKYSLKFRGDFCHPLSYKL